MHSGTPTLSESSGRSTKLKLGRGKNSGPSAFPIHLLLTCWFFFFPFVHNVKILSGNLNLLKNYSLSWPHNEPPSALLVLPQLCGAEGGSGYHQPSQNMFAPGTGQGMKSFLKAPTISKHTNSHSHLLCDLSFEISPCFHGLVTACLTLTLDIPAVHHVIWCCQAEGELWLLLYSGKLLQPESEPTTDVRHFNLGEWMVCVSFAKFSTCDSHL